MGIVPDHRDVEARIHTQNPWHNRAVELARWGRRYFARRDQYGGYYRKDGKTKTCNKPADGPAEDCVDLELLEQHFRARASEHVIGAHTLTPDGGGRYLAVDIDAHPGESADLSKRTNPINSIPNWSDNHGHGPLAATSSTVP